MKKLLFIALSILLFLSISPLFHGIFTYTILLINAMSEVGTSVYFHSSDFITFILIAYNITFVPAIIMGIIYAVLAAKYTRSTLLWLIPAISCVLYLVYGFAIGAGVFTLGSELIYFMISTSLLSIGGAFISTSLANVLYRAMGKTNQTRS